MFKHFAFGLRIVANRPIPELGEADFDGPADLQVWIGMRPNLQDDVGPLPGIPAMPWRRVFHLSPSGIILIRYDDETEFYIDPGSGQIWTTWVAPYTVEDMATYLLGPILGYVLRLRSIVALHASSVVVGNCAVALVGGAHAGKSTTAAAMAVKGISVLADDVTALEEHQGNFTVLPAYGHLRLWPESAEVLCGSRESLQPITPNWDKRDFDLLPCRAFRDEPAPLGAVYLLGERQAETRAPYVADVSGREGLLVLIANTYGNTLLDERMRAMEFVTLGRLLEKVPLRRLVPHTAPQRVWQLCDVILEDCKRFGIKA